MTQTKTFRKMTAAETINFFPDRPVDVLLDETISQLEPDLPKNYFAGEVAAGRMDAAVIQVGQTASYCIVYQVQLSGRRLYVCASVALPGGVKNSNALFAAVELIAKQKGCKNIVFATERKGLVQKALSAGYGVGGIELRKEI